MDMSSTPRTIRNLALAGFMGTGKSTVGRVVASHLQFHFVDTDELIQRRTGKSIAKIFTQNGAEVFRELEKRIVAELSQSQRTVISSGGGLIVNPANLASLKEHALVVCLWASPEAIWERVKNSTHRPLLQDTDPLKKIRTLLKERQPYYRQADVLVNTELRSLREVVSAILHEFHFALRKNRCPR